MFNDIEKSYSNDTLKNEIITYLNVTLETNSLINPFNNSADCINPSIFAYTFTAMGRSLSHGFVIRVSIFFLFDIPLD